MPRAGLSLERVASAGADLADEAGFGAVTVSVLARRLGVRTPSLYTYVEGNADLRVRIAALALEESADLVAAALAGRRGSAALAAYADAWRDFARGHPGRYDATRQPVPETGGAGSTSMLAAGRRHADLARDVLSGYRIAPTEQTHAIRLLGSLVHGYVSLELAGGFAHSEPSSESSWHYVIAQLDRWLTGPPTP